MFVCSKRPAVERLDPARLARRRVRARRTIAAVAFVVVLGGAGVFVQNTWFPSCVDVSDDDVGLRWVPQLGVPTVHDERATMVGRRGPSRQRPDSHLDGRHRRS